MKKLLCVFAHPDDESFLCGGTIAKYVKAGWTVDLLCATRGEAGERGVYESTEESLADIRVREVRGAAKFLGVHTVTFLEYKDGKLDVLHPGDMEDKLFTLLTEMAPDVVITFEPGGVTNHPDHIKVSQATTFAFQEYAKGRQDQPKLYFSCIPETVAEYLIAKKVFPKESFGRPWESVADKAVTTVIDISKFAKTKLNALKFHESQANDILKFYSIAKNPLTLHEFFIQRYNGTYETFMGKNDRVQNKL